RLPEFPPTRPRPPPGESGGGARGAGAPGRGDRAPPPKGRHTGRDEPEPPGRERPPVCAGGRAGRREEPADARRRVAAAPPRRRAGCGVWRGGDLPGAIGALRAAFRASRPTPGAEIQLGTYLGEAGKNAEASELLRRAVALEPTLDALNALGIAYARTGRPKD